MGKIGVGIAIAIEIEGNGVSPCFMQEDLAQRRREKNGNPGFVYLGNIFTGN